MRVYSNSTGTCLDESPFRRARPSANYTLDCYISKKALSSFGSWERRFIEHYYCSLSVEFSVLLNQIVSLQGTLPLFLSIYWAGMEPSPLLLRPLISLLYQPRMIHDDCGAINVTDDWQGKPKHSEKTCRRAAVFTTNPTWPEPRSNPGHLGGNRPLTALATAGPQGTLPIVLLRTRHRDTRHHDDSQ
jgi:hypothetical protein